MFAFQRASGVARIFVWRGRFCTPNRCNGPCTYYTTPNRPVCPFFNQYNGAYSKENSGLHREVHIASAEREPITGVCGHRRTGTPIFWTGGTVPTFKDVGEEFAVIRGDLRR